MYNYNTNNFMSFTETVTVKETSPGNRTSTGKHRSKGKNAKAQTEPAQAGPIIDMDTVVTEPSMKTSEPIKPSESKPVPLPEEYLVPEEPTEFNVRGMSSVREVELQFKLERLQSEYSHYRKRVIRDQDVTKEDTIESMLSALFPVLDDIVASRNFGDLTEGPFASIASKLETSLENYGLERIDEENVAFDPQIHEAVLRRPDNNVEEDYVSTILREGYKRGDKTLRAAQVIVSAGSE